MEGAVVRTFLFTDIEGSTRAWQAAPDGMAESLASHDEILRGAVAQNDGDVVKHTGDGVIAVFESPRSAIRAAIAAQRALQDAVPFGVRMALATGEARARDGDWFGPALNLCARLLAAGNGRQILVADATASLLRVVGASDVELADLGEYSLRDIAGLQRVFQAVTEGLVTRHPPVRAPSLGGHSLPAARTPLIGRDSELKELADTLAGTRVLTITGVGGVGKTRLAIELATRMRQHYPDGVFFVDLGVVLSGGDVSRAVADAVGLDASSTTEDLLEFLAQRRTLVVLDNCEHLLDETADLVETVLDRGDGTTVLMTSREPLGVEGERVWRAPSLSVVGENADAVTLFLERAGSVRRDAQDRANRAAVAEICERLDGIPLAIELAAAQAAHLSIAEIATRLGDRFSLLTGGRRRVQRQQTLLAAVDWSHDRLSADEQKLLRQVGVFPGWFTLAAVEAVTTDDVRGQAPALMSSLVAKSLVVSDEAWSGRFRLLETIRLYAEQRLVASGEAEDVRARHRDWAFGYVTTDVDPLGRTLDRVDRITEFIDDLRVALRWSVDRGDLRRAAIAANDLGQFWWAAGRHEEGIEWFEATLDADLDEHERATHLAALASFHVLANDFEATLRWTAAAAAATSDATSPGRLDADLYRAIVLLLFDPAEAERLLEDIIVRAGDDSYYLRMAREMKSHILLARDLAAASVELEDLVATSDPSRRRVDDFYALYNVGVVRHFLGDNLGALQAADELDRRGFTFGRSFLAYASQMLRILALAGLGEIAAAREQLAGMVELVNRSAIVLGDRDAAIGAAAICLHDGDAVRAVRFVGAARGTGEYLRLRMPISYGLHRHYRRATRAALRPDVSAAEYNAAREMDVRELLDEFLASSG